MDRDGFSVISLTSLGSTISLRLLSSVEELNELNTEHDQRLSPIAAALQELHAQIQRLDKALESSSVFSTQLQTHLSGSLGSCDGFTAALNKQFMRLEPSTLPLLDEGFLTAHSNVVSTYGLLFEFFIKVLAVPDRDQQDGALDSSEGKDVFRHISVATQRAASSMSSILHNDAQAVVGSGSKGPLPGDTGLPPPYEGILSATLDNQAPESPSSSSGFAKGFSSITNSFKAMTVGFWPKPDPLATAFCQAALRGDVQQMSGLLGSGASISGKNGEGNNPLSCAILANQETAVRYLISAGADIEKIDSSKMPPLFLAASVGHIEIARLLINQGARVGQKSAYGQPYLVDVVASENYDGIELLLQNGISPNITNLSGRPIIALIVKKGNIDLVRLLLRYGANPNSKDNTGYSLLGLAAAQERMDMINLLLQNGASANGKTVSGLSVLADSVNKRRLTLTYLLLEHGANANSADLTGQHILLIAIRDSKLLEVDKVELVRRLLKHGASPNKTDSVRGIHAMCYAMEMNNTEVIRYMLDAGGKTDKQMSSGETMLLYAMDNGRREQAQLLIEHGADVNAPDKKGRTPLIQAIAKRDMELMGLLKEKGADLNVAGKITPADLALSMDNMEVLGVLDMEPPDRPRSQPRQASRQQDTRNQHHSPPPDYNRAAGKY